MKKSCCIDDVNITPRSSSCSMLLRSACSHGHSHKHCVDTEAHKQEVNHHQKKVIQNLAESEASDNLLKFNSYLHSSLKRLAYKSARSYSVLKEGIYSRLELPRLENHKILNGDEVLKGFNEELHFSQISTPVDSFLNNNSINQEECSLINNNYITTSYSEIMSKSREFSRRSVSGSNALSESESEEGILKDKVRKRRSNKSLSRSSAGETESLVMNNNSNHVAARGSAVSYRTARTTLERASPSRGSLMSTSNVNYQTPPTAFEKNSEFNYSPGSDGSNFSHSEIDISTVQYTPVDKFRWFLWRSIYLKIIKCVNFDVWLLSRLQKYKRFIVLLLLLPLLTYLLFGAIIDDSSQKSSVNLSSHIISLSSYVYSSVSSPFVQNEILSESSADDPSCSKKFSDVLYFIYFAISNFFSNIFKKLGEIISVNRVTSPPEGKIKTGLNKEELKSIAIEVLEERLNDIVVKIQGSQFEQNIHTKREENIKNLRNEIANLHLEFKSLIGSVQKLEKDVSEKSEGSSLKYGGAIEDQNTRISAINTKLEGFEEKLTSLNGIIKNCCDQKLTISDFATSFEKHFLAALKNVVDGDVDKNTPYYFFNEWLHSKLANDKEKLSEELKFEYEKLKEEQKASGLKYDESTKILVEKIVAQYVKSLQENITSFNNIALSDEALYSLDTMRKIVKEAIMLYDADKTGLVDYALESGGGSILSTRCSESYAERDGTISVLGFPLWTTHNSPRTAIQPNMQPGQCWAFKGSHGFLVIQLAYTIYPTGFTLEHIPVSLSPSGSIDSAPKDFSAWGLISEKDNEGKLLGKYSYDQGGDPLQYFDVQHTYDEPFSFVELKILSNHGNLEYTCLYRFRVHGNQVKQSSTN